MLFASSAHKCGGSGTMSNDTDFRGALPLPVVMRGATGSGGSVGGRDSTTDALNGRSSAASAPVVTTGGLWRDAAGPREPGDPRQQGAAAAETGPVKKPFFRTRASSAGNAPNVSLFSVIRMLDLSHLRLKIVAFTFLSLVGALSQAVLLLVISEIVVAGVEGRALVPYPPRSLLHTEERDHRLVGGIGALLLLQHLEHPAQHVGLRAGADSGPVYTLSPGSSGPAGPSNPPSGSGISSSSSI